MKYPTDEPVKIVMLGAGGTGGHIAPHLYRLLYALNRPARFILCDGDIVEQKNLIRQNFSPADLGENKARVLAERYASVFGMEAEYVPNFVENLETLKALIMPKEWQLDPRIYRFVKEMVILIGAVDNNKSISSTSTAATVSFPGRWSAVCAETAIRSLNPLAASTRNFCGQQTSFPQNSPARRRPSPIHRAWRPTSPRRLPWWIWSTTS